MAWLIRCYDHAGRLLYVASTTAEMPRARVKSLAGEPWWTVVDQDKILISEVADEDLPKTQALAIATEQPKYYVDSGGNQPNLRLRPAPSDYARRLVQVSPLARLAEKRRARGQ